MGDTPKKKKEEKESGSYILKKENPIGSFWGLDFFFFFLFSNGLDLIQELIALTIWMFWLSFIITWNQ